MNQQCKGEQVSTHNQNGGASITADDPIALDQLDKVSTEAARRMIRDLDRHPHKHYWKQLGHTLFPLRMAGRMTICARAAGVTGPDLEILGHSFIQWVRTELQPSHDTPCLRTLSVLEQRADAKVDLRQASLTGTETIEELTQIEHDLGEHIARLDAFRRGIAMQKRRLQQDSRTRVLMRETARQRIGAGA